MLRPMEPYDLTEFELSAEYDEQYNPTICLYHSCDWNEPIPSYHLNEVVELARTHVCAEEQTT